MPSGRLTLCRLEAELAGVIPPSTQISPPEDWLMLEVAQADLVGTDAVFALVRPRDLRVLRHDRGVSPLFEYIDARPRLRRAFKRREIKVIYLGDSPYAGLPNSMVRLLLRHRREPTAA